MVNKLPTSIHWKNSDTPKNTHKRKKITVTKDMRFTFNKLPHPVCAPNITEFPLRK